MNSKSRVRAYLKRRYIMRKLNFKLPKRGMVIALTLGLILVVVTAAVVTVVAAAGQSSYPVKAYVNKYTGEVRIESAGTAFTVNKPPLVLGPNYTQVTLAGGSGTASASIIGGGGKGKKDATRYAPAFGDKEGDQEVKAQTPMAAAGTVSNLYIQLEKAPGTSKSYTFTMRKNGASTGVTCTISGAALTGSDLTNSVSYAAGDTIDIMIVPTGTPADTDLQWSAKFVPAP
jgi:hypothetical protein